jgi:hypothetical protein
MAMDSRLPFDPVGSWHQGGRTCYLTWRRYALLSPRCSDTTVGSKKRQDDEPMPRPPVISSQLKRCSKLLFSGWLLRSRAASCKHNYKAIPERSVMYGCA